MLNGVSILWSDISNARNRYCKICSTGFPFSHTSFNPLLPDEPVTDIINRNPPFRLRFELFLLRLNQSVGITAALINYIHFICLCITEYEEVMS